MTSTIFTDDTFANHTMTGHPEHAGRLESVIKLLKSEGIWPQLHMITANPATDAQILAVHKQSLLDLLAKTAQISQPVAMLGADTYITPQSYELARLAAGGVCAVVDEVMSGNAQNGLAAVRPPGHHATPSMSMGFCLLSNIAIAARHACQAYGLERVAIVDFDVHHGNGTQDCLYDDPKVLFISSHQSPLYPGTGNSDEMGKGAGKGFTANFPLPPGIGDDGFKQLYSEVVFPLLRRYQPQLILVSAGFDAHWIDPLANLTLSLLGFDFLARNLIQMAGDLCEGRIIFVMEGGYDLTALSYGWLNIASALLGGTSFQDPLGGYVQQQSLKSDLLNKYKYIWSLTD